MRKHLGFEIPLYVTQLQGQRLRAPSMGKCAFCFQTKHRVYLLGDDRPICDQCVEVAIAENRYGDDTDQRRPAEQPKEVIWEDLAYAGLTDKFDTAFWERAIR